MGKTAVRPRPVFAHGAGQIERTQDRSDDERRGSARRVLAQSGERTSFAVVRSFETKFTIRIPWYRLGDTQGLSRRGKKLPSIRRVSEHREGKLGMVISGMEQRIPRLDITVNIILILALILISGPVMVEFAREIRRPDGMDQAPVGMPFLSMMVIHFWMHMNEGNRQHPEPDPRQHHQTEQTVFRECASHHEWTVPPLDMHGNRAPYRSTLRNRRAFEITETELNVIAALANMGLSNTPTNGYRTPAATGTPTRL